MSSAYDRVLARLNPKTRSVHLAGSVHALYDDLAELCQDHADLDQSCRLALSRLNSVAMELMDEQRWLELDETPAPNRLILVFFARTKTVQLWNTGPTPIALRLWGSGTGITRWRYLALPVE